MTAPLLHTAPRPGLHPDMVFIPGGALRREGELPLVHIPNFYLSRYPVTNAQYLAFVADTGGNAPEWLEEGNEYNVQTGPNDYYKGLGSALTAPDHPVVGVSWHDAVAYCAWLSARTGERYRLPSETEWEYAGRGGPSSQGFPYAGGYRLEEVGWFDGNSRGATHPVGLKKPNELGLYDMSGNVWEWCADHWQNDYGAVPLDGSPWQGSGEEKTAPRVVRGGSWNRSNDDCRLSNRDWIFDADGRTDDFGFRPARY